MEYDGSIKIDTKIDTSGAEDDLDKLKNIAKTGAKTAGAAIVAGIGAATKVGMDFESSMSQVAATMGMTSDEIQNGSKEYTLLSDTAQKCGAETKYSASEAAEGLNYLALAGYDAEKSASALPKVLNLAAAGGIDLGYASDLVTDSMSALGLETSELDGFIDQMAKTSQKSNTNVAQLGEAILTVGGTARSLSGGTVELNTQLGVLADNGIKGSEGGTALRNVILSLSAPTNTAAKAMKKLGLEAFDSNGKLKPLNEVFIDLNERLSSLTDKEKTEVLNTIFNRVDLKSVQALLGTSAERFSDLENEIKNSSGAAATMAEVMNDNLKGKITILGSALEGLGINIYSKFEKPFKNAVDKTTDAVDALSQSIENGALSTAIDNLGFLVQTVGPGVVVLTATMKGYETATNAARAAQSLLNSTMSVNPAVLAIAGIAGLSLATFNLIMANDTLTEDIYIQSDAYGKLCDKVNTQKTAYDELKKSSDEQMNTQLAQIDYVEDLYNELENLTDATGKVEDADRARADFIVKEINEIIPNALEMTDGQIKKNKDLEQSIKDVLNTQRAKIILAAEEEKYSLAVKEVADAQDAQAQTASELALKQQRLNELLKEQDERLKNGLSADVKLTEQIAPLQRSVEELSGTLAEQTSTLEGYYNDIKRYEDDYKAVYSGNAEQIQAVINRTSDTYQNEAAALSASVDEKKEILARSVIDTETQYSLLLEKFKAGEGGITQAQVDAARERADKATEEFKAVGGNIVDGIIVGVSEKSEYLNVSISGVIKNAVDAAKAAADIHSPSRVMRDEVGSMLTEGIAVGIEQRADSAVNAMENVTKQTISAAEKYESEYARIKAKRDEQDKKSDEEQYQKRLANAKDAAEVEQIKQERILKLEKEGDDAYLEQLKNAAEKEEQERDNAFKSLKNDFEDEVITEQQYYTALAQLRNRYFEKGSEEWSQYSREIAKYARQTAEDIADRWQSIIESCDEDIADLVGNTVEKLNGYGELFTTITTTYKGMGEHGEDAVFIRGELNDLNEQTKALEEYADTLMRVKERGELPDGFFDELKEMSIDDGLLFAKTLLDASDSEFAAYLESYREKQEQTARIATVLNQEKIEKSVSEMRAELEKVYGEIPDSFFDCGGESAVKFKNGFLEQIPGMFEELRQAFADGMTAMMPSITFSGGAGSGGNSYTASYNFYSSGQTVSEQLAAARSAAVVERMRGNA